MGIVMGGGGYRGLKGGKPMVQMSTSRHGSKPDTIRGTLMLTGHPGDPSTLPSYFQPRPLSIIPCCSFAALMATSSNLFDDRLVIRRVLTPPGIEVP